MTGNPSIARALEIVMIIATAIKEARSIPSGGSVRRCLRQDQPDRI